LLPTLPIIVKDLTPSIKVWGKEDGKDETTFNSIQKSRINPKKEVRIAFNGRKARTKPLHGAVGMTASCVHKSIQTKKKERERERQAPKKGRET
jgi:hypothetical protein